MAVSDHVFHRFPFDLWIQVSASQLSLFSCIPFVLVATSRASEDAMRTSLPGFSSWFWSRPRWNGLPLRKYYGRKTRCPSLKICTLRNADRSNSCSHDMDVPYGFTYLENTWRLSDSIYRDGTEFLSVPSPHVYASSRHMLPQHQMFPVQQDPGLHSNKLTARRVPRPRII